MWQRTDVDFIHTQEVPWDPIPEGMFGALGGGRKQVLSRDESDGAETAIIRVRDRQSGILASDVDLYVHAGEGTIGGQELLTGDFVHVPAGTGIDIRPSVRGLALYCGFWGPSALTAGSGDGAGLRHLRPETMEWEPAGWSGDVALHPGAMVKRLRQGDGVNIYLAAMMPGWHCEEEESHPVYEESFKIHGDVLMGSRGVIREGGYFFRSPDVFHGPLYSRSGTMSLIRSDGPTTTTYREPPAGGTWHELARNAYSR
ncbi:hypothetical protein [Prauserella cavernicola]|uniref:DUF4437 domain-containing protein n=1 Tax=Prauserella cavernicola TaxID=2800127 RepID=A0A934V9C1_9PSEU|nr:hypothetical protein [Prauserella cavernicola]MBK1789190.1 hypothetical protein [Prauserella cavernicola]